jgi:ThiF family protein
MRLTEAQQERYARHLLLDGVGGDGQERLLASCVRIRGTGRAARWAARYLAASGIGTLILDDPAAAEECRTLSPDTCVLGPRDLDRSPDLDLDLHSSGEDEAERGAEVALRAVRELGRP